MGKQDINQKKVIPTPPKDNATDYGVVFAKIETQEESKTQPINNRSHSSILSNKEAVFDVSGAFQKNVEEGTIVTDKKSKKTSFGGALVGAFSEWAGNTKKKVTNTKLLKKEKVTKIAPAESRKGTINEASKGVTQAPHDDHKVVIQKIRTMAGDTERAMGKAYRIKKKGKDETSWTHSKKNDEIKKPHRPIPSVTVSRENLTPINEADLVAPMVEEYSESVLQPKPKPETPEERKFVRKESLISENTHIKTPVPKTRRVHSTRNIKPKKNNEIKSGWSFFKNKKGPTKEHLIQTQNVPEHLEQKILHTSKENLVEKEKELNDDVKTNKHPLQEQTVLVEESFPAHQEDLVETTKEFHGDEIKTKEDIAVNPELSTTINNETKSNLAKPLFVGVIIISIIAGVGTSIFIFNNPKDTILQVIENKIVSPIRTDTQTSVPFSNNRETLLSSIMKAVQDAPDGITQITIVNLSSERPSISSEIFETISPRAPSDFLRSIKNEMIIGSVTVTKNEPFIIMKSDSFDTAFAGIIDWEPFISADLAPLFGTPVSRTYDVNSRLQNNTVNARFIDTLIQNTGSRVLRDETDAERIVYTFINARTLVITTNSDALIKLFDAIR